jgi:hypothetical protein
LRNGRAGASAESAAARGSGGRPRAGSQRGAWSGLEDVGFGLAHGRSDDGQRLGDARTLAFGEAGAAAGDAGAESAGAADEGEAVAGRFRQRSLQRQSSQVAASLPAGWATELDPTTQVNQLS